VSARFGAHGWDRHGDRGVGDEAVELRGDVDFHDVARREHARTGYAMDDLLVDTDAREPGEIVAQLRRRAGAMSPQKRGADRIELRRRESRLCRALHLAQRLGDE